MIVKKLNEIMQKIGYVQKDTTVDMGPKGSYTGVTERKVLQTIRPLLVEKGIVIIPTNITYLERNGSVTTMSISYRIHDAEDGEHMEAASIGQGSSSGDKGANSAMTFAMKNLLLKMLLIESGDDPETVGDDKHDAEAEKNEGHARVLIETVNLMVTGGVIPPGQKKAMTDFIEKYKHDPKILSEVEKNLSDLKSKVAN